MGISLMPEAILYHNPKCSKSRKALELLKKHKINIIQRLYLKETLTKDMLEEIISLSKLSARDIIRSSEVEYKENNLDNPNLTQDEILDFIIKYPKLLQRPIFIFNNTAIIARPPEDILKII